MIPIRRLPEPEILRDKKEQWLAKFQEKRQKKPKARPSSGQYGHAKIRDVLRAMSFDKCFYCESELAQGDEEIDHYREVSEYPEFAFEWDNLYLSCRDCNRRKLSDKSINVTTCLDPCNDIENPADHLTFDAEYIFAKANSEQGKQTIRKYLLNREGLKYQRVRPLHQLERLIRTIMETLQSQEDQALIKQKTHDAVSSFMQADHAFSLMFRVYLDDIEI